MKVKRYIDVLVMCVAISIFTGLLSACNRNDKEVETLEPVTLTFYNADGQEDPWTDPIAKKITEETGVTLATDYPVDGNDAKITLMIATNEYADMIFAKGDGELLIENGAFIDMSELIDEYGPNIKRLYGDEYEKLRSEDGAIYQLCSTRVKSKILKTAGNAQLQWQVLEDNGYKIPYTLEEYGEMIKDYLSKDPIMDDGKRRIGISLCCSDWYWYTTMSNPSGYIANGSTDNGQWIVNTDGSVNYKVAAEGQKEYFRWLNKMYATGILDADFATHTHEEYLQKIAEGRVIGLMDADWSYQPGENILKESDMYESTYAGLPVTIDENIKCASLMDQGLAVGWGVGISKSCKDPVRAVRFLDWICTDEAQILLNWGIEGVNYYYDQDGIRRRTQNDQDAYLKSEYAQTTGIGIHLYPFPAYGSGVVDPTGNTYAIESEAYVKENYSREENKALEAWDVDMLTDIFPQPEEFEEPLYTPLWSKNLPSEISEIERKLDSITWPGLVDCIVCGEDRFDEKWDKMMSELKEAGIDKAEQIMTDIVMTEIRTNRISARK